MNEKISVHYHSECTFFAGCESMLANFFNSNCFRKNINVSFSYVNLDPYVQGLRKRVHNMPALYPVNFWRPIECDNLPKFIPLMFRRATASLLRLLLIYPLAVYQIFVLYRIFKRINPDILHINNGGYPAARSALEAAIAGKLAGIPKVVMVVNNMAADYRHYSRWVDFPIDRFVARSVDLFITGSHAAAARLQKVLRLESNKLETIHNGIELRNQSSTMVKTRRRLGLENFTGIVFGVVALLIPRKGHQVLLDAVLELVIEENLTGGEFIVLIEGDGVLRESLINFVIINKLTPWIHFVGNEENIVDFMAALDVLILPSIQDEDFPNVILEAMALAKPVIASRLAGTPEQVVDEDTGYLVEPRNHTQLAEAILGLTDCPVKRGSMGLAGLARFNNYFTSQIALNNYSNLYARLMKE